MRWSFRIVLLVALGIISNVTNVAAQTMHTWPFVRSEERLFFSLWTADKCLATVNAPFELLCGGFQAAD